MKRFEGFQGPKTFNWQRQLSTGSTLGKPRVLCAQLSRSSPSRLSPRIRSVRSIALYTKWIGISGLCSALYLFRAKDLLRDSSPFAEEHSVGISITRGELGRNNQQPPHGTYKFVFLRERGRLHLIHVPFSCANYEETLHPSSKVSPWL